LSDIVPYRRRSKTRHGTHGVFARWSHLPWLPLAVLMLVATTFITIQFVSTSTHQLSKEMESAAVADDNRVSTADAPMPLCKGWPRVNCVIDGDTIWYRGEKIRIADINAPETHDPHCAYEADLGRRATDRMISLLNAGPFDIAATGDRDEDVYGRKLRIVERNGRSLGQILVSEGLAERWQGYRRNWCA
jgi:endonuclease YncB( thermonuclease family)